MPYISGFAGSNGHMLVTQDVALLWTDGRYFLQAERELGPGWTLMKIISGVERYNEWITAHMKPGSRIGYDPFLLTAQTVKARTGEFSAKSMAFVPTETNLVNEIWLDRPPMSSSPVVVLPVSYAGETIQEKVSKLVPIMQSKGAKYVFVSRLDEIAWLLNLRGADIDFNPVFFAYLLVETEEIGVKLTLFINEGKIEAIRDYILSNSIQIQPYNAVISCLSALFSPVLVSEDLNFGLFSQLPLPLPHSDGIPKLKSVKSPREVQGMKDCHVRDGRAVCRFLAWLEQQVIRGEKGLNELSVAKVLEGFRAQEPGFRGLSFETISAVGGNAAVIHYKPKEGSAADISQEKIYLLDSGGHYWDGTTDITRTVHFGTPTAREKECYTRVLLGNLDLCRATWPENVGISGADMDILARRWLWEAGLDYMHGTGHGVGYYLNVHEGPQGIGRYRTTPLVPGMNVTDEPGYYEAGSFGIRIEDLLFVTKLEQPAGFLGFENVTICPYDVNLIASELLSERDKDFLNAYHRKVWSLLSSTLDTDPVALAWLQHATAPIT